MRKNVMWLLALMMVFAMSMFAQTTSSTSDQSSTGTSTMSSGQSTAPSTEGSNSSEGSQPMSGNMDQYPSSSGTDQSQTSNPNAPQTVEGCVYREQSDYYIFPASGNQGMKVSGQDLSSHLGHHVVLHGNQQPSGADNMASNAGTTTSSSTVSPSGSSSTSRAQAGTGNMNTSDQEFVVDRIDMVSESCPTDIQNKIQSSGGSISR